MASVFTFEPDPPRVASPWVTSAKQSPGILPRRQSSQQDMLQEFEGLLLTDAGDANVTGLDAEPQEGPTEYKLHLLLRPRRTYTRTSTSTRVSGSQHFKNSTSSTPRSLSEHALASSPHTSQATGSRQHRLEQLTTQLLWRLQQSSPHHSSSASNVILPSLPEATSELQPPLKIGKLLPGLEESKGALYEIGVTDDGTFIGLTKDEMTESLNNLRAMAACLGCSVDILRMVRVGECEWQDLDGLPQDGTPISRSGRLYVAEAYVKPELDPNVAATASSIRKSKLAESSSLAVNKEQLRISFTGATNAGKSSLLGTLSTSTLDSGRGKSRLSLLKHRHEIASGVTSSVSQELFGYQDLDGRDDGPIEVINYATENVSTWIDVHNRSTPGRLVFVSDSAGHPRYRRTTVRGLVSWAPHWTLLCVAATDDLDVRPKSRGADDGGDGADSDQAISFSASGANLSMAHLDLCLRLGLRLVVVITKFDIATRIGARQVLSSILTALKMAGKVPVMLPNDTGTTTEQDLQTMPAAEVQNARKIANRLKADANAVPIIFTSAVKGTGICKLHCMLRSLPIPRTETSNRSTTSTVFHIDDSFRLHHSAEAEAGGVIISGHLASGTLSIGQELLIGPFTSVPDMVTEEKDALGPNSNPDDPFLTPRSFNDALAKVTLSSRLRASSQEREWRRVRIISIRNLRMPVKMLQQDQVGTVGLTPVLDGHPALPLLVRKGLVLAAGEPTSAHSFSAIFGIADASSVIVGSLVLVYFASVRASAKVVAVSLKDSSTTDQSYADSSDDLADEDAFGFEFDAEDGRDETISAAGAAANAPSPEAILVSFQFSSSREFVNVGTKVLVMPGGGGGGGAADRAGALDGFVGNVVERFE